MVAAPRLALGLFVFATWAVACATHARAGTVDEGFSATATPNAVPPAPTTWSGARSAEAGMFLPFTLSPRAGTQRSRWCRSSPATTRSAASCCAPRRRFTPSDPSSSKRARSTDRRRAFSRASASGIDLAIGAQYDGASYEGKPGFETFVALSRQLGRVGLFANFVYGQELDETQRHGEVRLAALVRVATPVYAGLDGRIAFDLDPGRTVDADSVSDVDFVATVGPTVSYSVKWFSLLLSGGATAMRWKGRATELGGTAVAGFGLTLF